MFIEIKFHLHLWTVLSNRNHRRKNNKMEISPTLFSTQNAFLQHLQIMNQAAVMISIIAIFSRRQLFTRKRIPAPVSLATSLTKMRSKVLSHKQSNHLNVSKTNFIITMEQNTSVKLCVMVEEYTMIKTAPFTTVNGMRTKDLERERSYSLMAQSTMENGNQTRSMEKEFICQATAIDMRATSTLE